MIYMFDSFEKPQPIPDNMHRPIPSEKGVRLVNDNLDSILDKKGHKKGYSWNYGETVSIPISVNIPVRIESSSFVYYSVGEEPSFQTQGFIGQKCYNVKDVKSWICTSYVPDEKKFIWTEEPNFTFPEFGERKVILEPVMTNKYILIEFLNFRGEQMFEQIFEEVNECSLDIDHDNSLLIQRGIYEMNIYIGAADYHKLTKRYEIVVR